MVKGMNKEAVRFRSHSGSSYFAPALFDCPGSLNLTAYAISSATEMLEGYNSQKEAK